MVAEPWQDKFIYRMSSDEAVLVAFLHGYYSNSQVLPKYLPEHKFPGEDSVVSAVRSFLALLHINPGEETTEEVKEGL